MTDLRPLFSIQIGHYSMLDRVRLGFPDATVTVHVASDRAAFTSELVGVGVNSPLKTLPFIALNGRVGVDAGLLSHLRRGIAFNHDVLLTYKGAVVAVVLATPTHIDQVVKMTLEDPTVMLDHFRPLMMAIELDGECDVVTAPWEWLNLIPAVVNADISAFPMGIIRGHVQPYVTLINDAQIYVGNHSKLEDFVVIDATAGPVIIADHVVIESHTRICGPAYIGPHSQVMGGKLRGSSIGPWCKVSGEISACVFAGYSNKAHDGFWGNSYVGHWCNIGAGSITSNLKNTYGEIILNYYGAKRATGQQFLGALMGDHVKLGIGTHLPTGTVIGTGTALFGTAVHDKGILNFTWGEKGDYSVAELDRILVTASRVRARRGAQLSTAESAALSALHSERVGSNGSV